MDALAARHLAPALRVDDPRRDDADRGIRGGHGDERLEQSRIDLGIVVQDQRSLARNQEIAINRLNELVAQALAPPAPPRRPTRPGRASRERRLAEKARRGRDKTLRRAPQEAG